MTVSRRTVIGSAGVALLLPAIACARTAPTVPATAVGAKGDGRTDDAAALRAALQAGHVVDGRGGTFGIDGNLKIGGAGFAGLVNATLLELTPAVPGRRTLTIERAANFRLENVTVLRGGTGAENPDRAMMNDTGGLFVQSCHDFRLDGVTVAGGGIGTGLAIYDSQDFTLAGCRARDMLWRLARMPADDAIQGMLFGRCRRFTVTAPVATDIGGRVGGRISHDQNRGIAVTGCSDFTIADATVSAVGQGIDVSGSGGNTRFRIVRGQISDVATWGYKFANTAQGGTVTDAVATRCGIGGFVASGPGPEDVAIGTRDIQFTGCSAHDMDCAYGNSLSFGFGVLMHAWQGEPAPNRIVFRDCTAQGRAGGAMQYGFVNQVTGIADPADRNRLQHCTATGFGRAATLGFA